MTARSKKRFCPQSVTLCLEHDIDVSRGDMIVGLENLPGQSSDLHAHVCWMNKRPLQAGKKYFLKHATQTVQAVRRPVGKAVSTWPPLNRKPRPARWR